MTVVLPGQEVARQLAEHFSDAVLEADDSTVLVKADSLFEVAEHLKNSPMLGFDYLSMITAVDYYDYFEVVYLLYSLSHNHSLVLKARCHDRSQAVVPSVVGLWRGADLQEREIYDLMGIRFEGHPNMKRIVLWDGFDGHPLRKDYL